MTTTQLRPIEKDIERIPDDSDRRYGCNDSLLNNYSHSTIIKTIVTNYINDEDDMLSLIRSTNEAVPVSYSDVHFSGQVQFRTSDSIGSSSASSALTFTVMASESEPNDDWADMNPIETDANLKND